jgi:hypothetical protein
MGFHVLGERLAYLVLADAVAREAVAMFTVLRRRALGDPALHAIGSGRAQVQTEEPVDATYGSERIRVELPLIHIIELTGPICACFGRTLDRPTPVGALPRPDHLRGCRIAPGHAGRHMEGAAERENRLHGIPMRLHDACIWEHR